MYYSKNMSFRILNDMTLIKGHKQIMKENDIIIIKPDTFESRTKILGLDFDHTIVKPHNGNTYPKNSDDWQWLYPCIPEVIRKYYNNGYCIVIFTNQNRTFKLEQIYNVMNILDIPYKVYIGKNKEYKKPSRYMFDLFINNDTDNSDNTNNTGKTKSVNSVIVNEIDYTNSLYVGDALGRRNDWSDCDLKYALNCGLNYKSPEEFYNIKDKETTIIKHPCEVIEKQELVLMVGYPASGKTTYTKLYETEKGTETETKTETKTGTLIENNNYVVLHGDVLKTESKIKKNMKELLKLGKSIVIDATNPSKKKRKSFIDYSKNINPDIKTRIIHFTGDISECMERNNKREITVPSIAFYMYRKNYEEPTSDEVDIIDTYNL